jgi:hypothetical protein
MTPFGSDQIWLFSNRICQQRQPCELPDTVHLEKLDRLPVSDRTSQLQVHCKGVIDLSGTKNNFLHLHVEKWQDCLNQLDCWCTRHAT